MKNFYLLCASRVGTCLGTMAFAGSLPVIRSEWHLDASSAGSIQMVFSISNALALFTASWLSDYFGARKVYLIFSWGGVLALIAFACFASSYSSALGLMTLVGLTQGGAYTPAMMLAMQMNSPTKRGFAVGAILAAGSLGYLLSVFIASFSALKWGTSVAFWFCAVGALGGAVLGSKSVSGYSNIIKPPAKTGKHSERHTYCFTALLLLTGYVAHCWELLGNWAWTPGMLTVSLQAFELSPLTTGFLVAITVHFSGILSTLIVGTISDYFNRASILIFMSAAGAAGSVLLGYSFLWGGGWVITIAFISSFFILGDSGIFSAAIADNVPPEKLGRVLGIRSLLGFGIGSFSPFLFGIVLDVTHRWEMAYLILATGGIMAFFTAVSLKFWR